LSVVPDHKGFSTMPRRAPNTQNRTVAIRKPNRDLRTREYLTPGEVRTLMAAARKNRHVRAPLIRKSIRKAFHFFRGSPLAKATRELEAKLLENGWLG
jgi:hypothetical protein